MKRAALAAIVLLATAPPAAAQDLIVRGRVLNGTTGQPPPSGTRVRLAVVAEDGGRIDAATTETDRSGGFSQAVVFAPGARVVVSTRFEGITYSTIARAGASVGRAELRVFGTTRDPSVISVDADTIVMEPAGSVLEALAIVRVTNGSDRTFIGQRNDSAVFRLPLPQGAFSVRVVEGVTPGRAQPEGGALEIGDPLQPGDATFTYAYKLRGDDGVWAVDRAVIYPTNRLDLLVDPGIELTGGGFRLLGNIDFGGESYRQFAGDDLAPGRTVSFSVATDGGLGVVPVAAGATALVAMVASVWLLGRSRRKVRPEASTRNDILEAIAALDLAHEAGAVESGEYRSRREALKRDLARTST